ncbi:hypothetical protein H7J08_02385 [Mycobacterium frederiksbergense]|uniref:hypothetical protein n=1 Tax=Mycolicibacterium frederiksbergense TaxID=117567 RepID=UPI0021F34488|nr:hypothetical protein [Mycolicibacterium frederiksbergense]MCV7043526.1 hypothetical protein [Mycolicibacterium frederiksbergense]
MTRFNKPPNWPDFPDNWTPGPDWNPDPSWDPAPRGWRFWSEEATPFGDARSNAAEVGGDPRRRPILVAATLISGLILAAGTGVVVKSLRDKEPSVGTPDVALTFVPRHPTVAPFPPSVVASFEDWTRFGGIDATVSETGAAVVLDTHDTVETWDTKWSGLKLDGPEVCSLQVTGRVRSISHSPGVAGGFGIGIGAVEGLAEFETLMGAAVQFDVGQQGYRLATYPSDGDSGFVAAALDHAWHTIDLTIEESGAVLLEVDGRLAVEGTLSSACGRPIVRVWAGAAEFADFVIEEGPK